MLFKWSSNMPCTLFLDNRSKSHGQSYSKIMRKITQCSQPNLDNYLFIWGAVKFQTEIWLAWNFKRLYIIFIFYMSIFNFLYIYLSLIKGFLIHSKAYNKHSGALKPIVLHLQDYSLGGAQKLFIYGYKLWLHFVFLQRNGF